MKPLRILFFLQHAGYLRHYAGPIRILAERGHAIHIGFSELEKDAGDARLVEELVVASPAVTHDLAPRRDRGDPWRGIAFLLRGLLDSARYSHPRYERSGRLRERMLANLEHSIGRAEGLDPLTRRFALAATRRLHRSRGARAASALVRMLMAAEEAVPSSARIDGYIARHRPDVVAVSPAVELGSDQVEYVKSGRRLGIPTAVCVASWDNLTGKGLIRLVPDRVLVWNAAQRLEAVELHRIPAERVVLTGAQRFDAWFGRSPSTSRAAFADRVGIDAGQPFLLYVCSSPFIAPHEVAFVRRWLEALRSTGGDLGVAGVVIRPHPQNAEQWRDVALPGAVVWPREGAQPDGGVARDGYFDSLFHCAAVVGVNTSALIEAAIVGRRVFTILDSSFRGTQEGTLHFQHLRAENGGFLHEAPSLDVHVAQLRGALARPGEDAPALEFVRTFVRPGGLGRPAAELVAAALSELAGTVSLRSPVPRTWRLAARLLLEPFVLGTRARRGLPRRDVQVGTISPVKTVSERHLAAALKELRRGSGGVVAERWPDGPVSELLVWIPFLREAVARGAVAAEDLVAVANPGTKSWYAGVAAVASAGPPAGRRLPVRLLLELLQEVREERAPIRALTARLRYERSPAGVASPSERPYHGPWGAAAALALTRGLPTVAITTAEEAASTEVDLAFRAARSVGARFSLVDVEATVEARAFLDQLAEGGD